MDKRKVLSLILGGGRGDRLFPLTMLRSKPAVPVAGKYRLIDIPISNCINSGLNRIYVLTQFMSVSLHRHIANTYKFDMFGRSFVEVLAAQQTQKSSSWYQGTADAIRQNIRQIEEDDCTDVLILSGDQLYRMNFRHMLATHVEAKADITIAALPVHESAVGALGILKTNDAGRVVRFKEKPDMAAKEHVEFHTPANWIEARQIPCNNRNYLASMGIYLFRREVLLKLLADNPNAVDFGKHIFQSCYNQSRVHVHLFDGYWEDVGTIKSYHEASLALASDNAPFEFQSQEGVIYTRMRFLPPTQIRDAVLKQSLVSDGCVVNPGATIERSVLGVRARIGEKTFLRDTVIIGADRFETDAERAENKRIGKPNFNVGDNCHIERAILDKDCRVGNNVRINYRGTEEKVDGDCYYIRDGIVCIPKGAVVKDGMVI